jgi:hypothetical protein
MAPRRRVENGRNPENGTIPSELRFYSCRRGDGPITRLEDQLLDDLTLGAREGMSHRVDRHAEVGYRT